MRAFISYSHMDELYRVELDKHMALLKRQGVVDLWSDHCIRPGEEVDAGVNAALEASELILLLISADFINSDYCYSTEMERAMARHQEGSATVVPIILRPCDWHSAPFGRLKALPTDGKAVTRWANLDEAFLDITQQLRQMLMARAVQASTTAAAGAVHPAAAAAAAVPAAAPRIARSSDLTLPRDFTDEEKHDFLIGTFSYIQRYFEQSLAELHARQASITSRITSLSPESFKVIMFRDGKRVAGCHIRISSHFGTGIAYSGNEADADNSYNEMVSVKADKHLLYLAVTMDMFGGGRDQNARLTEQGAAEHLWSKFIAQVR